MTNHMEILDLANQAAVKNDRWMFIATLLCFGLAVFWAFRWLVAKHEKITDQGRADQQQYTTSLLNITAENNRCSRDLLSVLEKNTLAIESNTDVIEKCQTMIAVHEARTHKE